MFTWNGDAGGPTMREEIFAAALAGGVASNGAGDEATLLQRHGARVEQGTSHAAVVVQASCPHSMTCPINIFCKPLPVTALRRVARRSLSAAVSSPTPTT
jgi:hypothetical protein